MKNKTEIVQIVEKLDEAFETRLDLNKFDIKNDESRLKLGQHVAFASGAIKAAKDAVKSINKIVKLLDSYVIEANALMANESLSLRYLHALELEAKNMVDDLEEELDSSPINEQVQKQIETIQSED